MQIGSPPELGQILSDGATGDVLDIEGKAGAMLINGNEVYRALRGKVDKHIKATLQQPHCSYGFSPSPFLVFREQL